MKYLFVVLVFFLTGCAAATYEVERKVGNDFTKVKIKSDREIEGLQVDYDRENGTFSIHTGAVTTGPQALQEAAAKAIGELPSVIKAVAGIPNLGDQP